MAKTVVEGRPPWTGRADPRAGLATKDVTGHDAGRRAGPRRGVVLVDLDDTLVPDVAARDTAMRSVLSLFGARADLDAVWSVVREEWHASRLGPAPALAGVSSWEALWTDLPAALRHDQGAVRGQGFQTRTWRRLLPGVDPSQASAAFRRAREGVTRPYAWVGPALAEWTTTHQLWCATNGSSWLQRRKLQLAGLEEAFSDVVVSGEVGAVKADPRFSTTVRARLGRAGAVPVAVVGDSPASDGALAAALGVPHVRVVPGERPVESWTRSA